MQTLRLLLTTMLLLTSAEALSSKDHCEKYKTIVENINVNMYKLVYKGVDYYSKCTFEGKSEESFDIMLSEAINFFQNFIDFEKFYSKHGFEIENECLASPNPQLVGRSIDNFFNIRLRIGLLAIACTKRGEKIYNEIKNPYERQRLFLGMMHEKAMLINKEKYDNFLKLYDRTQNWVLQLPEYKHIQKKN